jgi:hypothetical protein
MGAFPSHAFGEKGVSDDVSAHDRIGLPAGAQADERYGDAADARSSPVAAEADDRVRQGGFVRVP